MLNPKSIIQKNTEIRIKFLAEKNDPRVDIGCESLRFGSAEEIDYVRGALLKRVESDMILLFEGNGSGIASVVFVG